MSAKTHEKQAKIEWKRIEQVRALEQLKLPRPPKQYGEGGKPKPSASPGAITGVLHAIDSFTGGGEWQISVDQIAERSRFSRATVQRAIYQLERWGILAVTRVNELGYRWSRYAICWPTVFDVVEGVIELESHRPEPPTSPAKKPAAVHQPDATRASNVCDKELSQFSPKNSPPKPAPAPTRKPATRAVRFEGGEGWEEFEKRLHKHGVCLAPRVSQHCRAIGLEPDEARKVGRWWNRQHKAAGAGAGLLYGFFTTLTPSLAASILKEPDAPWPESSICASA